MVKGEGTCRITEQRVVDEYGQLHADHSGNRPPGGDAGARTATQSNTSHENKWHKWYFVKVTNDGSPSIT